MLPPNQDIPDLNDSIKYMRLLRIRRAHLGLSGLDLATSSWNCQDVVPQGWAK
jgi:hypothetical protein